MSETRRQGRIERSARAKLRRASTNLDDNPLAAGLVSLAVLLDAEGDSAKLATGLRELRMLLGELAGRGRGANPSRSPAEGSPAAPDLEPEVDAVDDLTARRTTRRGAAG